ncbi:hypothetical protein IE3_05687, partial [Bacillus cereus BAG3X2-1]
YISRIKSNTRIYQKNPNPDYFQDGRIKKGTEGSGAKTSR